MHSLMATVATTLALNGFSPPADPGWEGAVWRMTPEQVSAAVPGVRPVRRGESLSNARQQHERDAMLYGIRVEAEYFYGPDGLDFIRFEVPFRRCEALVDGLLTEHGSPTEVHDQAILRLITWEDPDAGNKLVLLYSTARICDLRIRSIEDAGNGYD